MSQLPLKFDAKGLVPVVVQDELTGEIRMFAFATEEAVRTTQRTGLATFWSRSRGELWQKGRTSGTEVHVSQVLADCDADCVIYLGDPKGNTCHSGAPSCFFQSLEGESLQQASEQPQTLLKRLEAVLDARKQATGASSYTKSLYDGGAPKIGGKIREEADELARALAGERDERVIAETADVLYHVLVGLRWRGIDLRSVLAELAGRLGRSGHEEKASRPREGARVDSSR
ncbi:MAG TPA: bifunctional phosphoribosyl-AMP cyclohydrolase/phosphoribosyl-ATP diphosphatase HisIE [Polyangiaceae bacterium]|nr:bifunctional phosphoribosyl-AMP cyclohydrolase/phosphoribosyl-ATP diphosphatase HisIE [Polyangiaceae bacterium]